MLRDRGAVRHRKKGNDQPGVSKARCRHGVSSNWREWDFRAGKEGRMYLMIPSTPPEKKQVVLWWKERLSIPTIDEVGRDKERRMKWLDFVDTPGSSGWWKPRHKNSNGKSRQCIRNKERFHTAILPIRSEAIRMSSLCLFFPSAISVIGFPRKDRLDTLEKIDMKEVRGKKV